ncbi:MAG: CtsR family transcriptional regulator [Clostridia bacterium]|nr:CtsR family transcriptional regulator [Clostridia bacterium]
MNLSNAIAQMITEMLSEQSEIEIQRNVLAQDLGCVPSQINYVLSSRFTPERGYIVESRRGGKGCIRITRVSYDKNTLIMKVIGSVGQSVDERAVDAHLMNLLYNELISKRDATLISVATSDSTLRGLPTDVRDILRATIFKQMLLTVTE